MHRLGLGLLAGVLASLLPAASHAECKRQALDVPVRIVNQRPIVTLTVSGVELPMLLDTGAFHSVLLPVTAAQLGLPELPLPDGMRIHGYAGEIKAHLTRAPEVTFQGLKLKNMEFVVGGNELGAGIRGIVGRNLLGIADTEYDLARGKMLLHVWRGDCDRVQAAYWADGVPVIEADLEGSVGDKRLLVDVRINGVRMKTLMDTGAPRSILTRRAVGRAGVSPGELTEAGRTGGAGQGSYRVWHAPLKTFELGGQKIGPLVMDVSEAREKEQDLLLGLDYFLAHRIFVSFSRGKLYATWNGGDVFGGSAVAREGDARSGAMVPSAEAGDTRTQANLAAAAMARGDAQAALTHLDAVVAAQPGVAAHRLVRARALLALRRGEPALADLDEALRLEPGLHEARLQRADLNTRRGRREAVDDDLRALDTALGADDDLRRRMGALYAAAGRLPEASAQWDRWLQARPQDNSRAQVLSARCWLRTRLGQELEAALKDCEAAIAVDEQVPAFHNALGWLLLRTGQAERARSRFGRALGRGGEQAWAHYGRALSHRRLGDEPAALEDLAKARSLLPDIDEQIARAGFDTRALGSSAPSSLRP